MIDKTSNAVINVGCEMSYGPRIYKGRDLGQVSCRTCGSCEWVTENQTVETVAGGMAQGCNRLSEVYKQEISPPSSRADSAVRGDGSYELVAVALHNSTVK